MATNAKRSRVEKNCDAYDKRVVRDWYRAPSKKLTSKENS